jgi:hypothetical protein
MQSPLIFRRWAAVMCVAGALERKVWTVAFSGRITYPSMYVLLIGGPGVGKTESIRKVRELWLALPDLHVAPSSVSRASLVDSLNEATREILRPTAAVDRFVKFNSLQVGAYEFGTFLTAYDGEFLSVINDLYDCNPFKEKKRSMKDTIDIKNPQLNIFAGTTPAWLGATLPETAWSEGFSSRLMMIYSGERVKVDPFADAKHDEALNASLVSDLQDIHSMYGQFSFTEEFIESFRAWYDHEFSMPSVEHPKLEHYIPRRHIHFLKLCMVMSAQRSSSYLITRDDFREAADLFTQAEESMPDVFKAMRYNSDSNVIDEAYHYVFKQHAKLGQPVSEHMIVRFLSERMPSHNVPAVLKIMVDAGLIKVASVGTGFSGRNAYSPVPRS